MATIGLAGLAELKNMKQPGKGTDVPHHNPKFNVDEDVMWEGAAVFVSIVEEFLNGAE